MSKTISRVRMLSQQLSRLSALAAMVGGLSVGCSPMASDDARPLDALKAPLAEKGPSTATTRLEALRVDAEQKNTPEADRAYLAAFPQTFASFKEAFATSGPNSLESKCVEHLDLLEKLSKTYQDEVLTTYLNVCVGGAWDADAIGILQDQVTRFAAAHPKVFAAAMAERSANDQQSIVRFLADVENPDANSDYERLILGLESSKIEELARRFVVAREERARASNH